MAAAVTRRQWLRADPTGHRPVVRPPWASPRFHDTCTRCNECLPACPEHVLRVGDGGFPEIDFRRGECTFCEACAKACTAGAITRRRNGSRPWRHVVRVGPDCLEALGVHCHACLDPCPEAAVRFPRGHATRPPEIDPGRCTGCGACIAPCPVRAIHVHVPSPTTEEVHA
ncbi:MAG: ferredoxin-type protein NapF [Gammaproteobacteria bacterium]|nr:ferredoxin-type protein NapF [Gammaproteobacteria bacterium]